MVSNRYRGCFGLPGASVAFGSPQTCLDLLLELVAGMEGHDTSGFGFQWPRRFAGCGPGVAPWCGSGSCRNRRSSRLVPSTRLAGDQVEERFDHVLGFALVQPICSNSSSASWALVRPGFPDSRLKNPWSKPPDHHERIRAPNVSARCVTTASTVASISASANPTPSF
jgi:hypothetical protein